MAKKKEDTVEETVVVETTVVVDETPVVETVQDPGHNTRAFRQQVMADKSKMQCNRPTASDRPGKKKMVKACSGGEEKLLHFGAKGYGNNYSAAARKSFKARHSCDTANDKLTPRYWACKNLWAGPGGSTTSNPSNRKGKY